MKKTTLHTDNPYALQALMSETIFSLGEQVQEARKVDPTYIPSAAPDLGLLEEFLFKGENKKHILFLIRDPNQPYMSAEAYDAFLKMLTALQLTEADIALMNVANERNSSEFKQIMNFFTPQKIILLGVDPPSLKLPAIPLNALQKGRVSTVFHTFSLEEMLTDLAKKKAFWIEFKNLISL